MTSAATIMQPADKTSPGVRMPVKPIAFCLLMLVCLIAWYQTTASTQSSTATRPQIDGIAMRFEDRPNGDIAVVAHSSNQVIQTIAGEAPFIRGVLRSLVRARKQNQQGASEPFWLGHSRDGASSIEDRATGARIELDAFGKTNLASFTQIYLNAKNVASSRAVTP